ncbi:MAG: hypothetical protein JSR31_17950 [Nitrospira sp.]|nr:hypothetical protein [Nitrospira sp.]
MAKRKQEKIPWFAAFEEVEPYVVKITTPQASGTGFLIATTKGNSLLGIATAAHVIDVPHYWEQLGTTDSYTAFQIRRNHFP